MAVDTGLGATLTLGTTGSVGVIRSLTLPELTLNDIDTSHLGTTGQRTYIGGDLVEGGEIVAEVLFDTLVNALESFGVSETVTITFPISVNGNTTNATLAGTGYIKGQKFPDMQIDELQVYNLTIKVDGQTDFAWTPESA